MEKERPGKGGVKKKNQRAKGEEKKGRSTGGRAGA